MITGLRNIYITRNPARSMTPSSNEVNIVLLRREEIIAIVINEIIMYRVAVNYH